MNLIPKPCASDRNFYVENGVENRGSEQEGSGCTPGKVGLSIKGYRSNVKELEWADFVDQVENNSEHLLTNYYVAGTVLSTLPILTQYLFPEGP